PRRLPQDPGGVGRWLSARHPPRTRDWALVTHGPCVSALYRREGPPLRPAQGHLRRDLGLCQQPLVALAVHDRAPDAVAPARPRNREHGLLGAEVMHGMMTRGGTKSLCSTTLSRIH